METSGNLHTTNLEEIKQWFEVEVAGSWRVVKVAIKGNVKDSYDDGKVLYLKNIYTIYII